MAADGPYQQREIAIGAAEAGLRLDRALQRRLERTRDPKEVIGQLRRLDEVLAGYNPTLGNLELSKHIAEIVCHRDGRIELRGTMLGLFEGAVELLSRADGAHS